MSIPDPAGARRQRRDSGGSCRCRRPARPTWPASCSWWAPTSFSSDPPRYNKPMTEWSWMTKVSRRPRAQRFGCFFSPAAWREYGNQLLLVQRHSRCSNVNGPEKRSGPHLCMPCTSTPPGWEQTRIVHYGGKQSHKY